MARSNLPILLAVQPASTADDGSQRCLKKGIVAPSEPYVIAINGRSVPHALLDDQPSYIVRSVFPFGLNTVTLDTRTGKVIDQRFRYRAQIIKESGSSVHTSVFEQAKYAGISAVLYSIADESSSGANLGSDFQLIHNPLASAPIPRGWLEVGTEFWANDDELASHYWGPPTPPEP